MSALSYPLLSWYPVCQSPAKKPYFTAVVAGLFGVAEMAALCRAIFTSPIDLAADSFSNALKNTILQTF